MLMEKEWLDRKAEVIAVLLQKAFYISWFLCNSFLDLFFSNTYRFLNDLRCINSTSLWYYCQRNSCNHLFWRCEKIIMSTRKCTVYHIQKELVFITWKSKYIKLFSQGRFIASKEKMSHVKWMKHFSFVIQRIFFYFFILL